jgi:hypothetical protein
MFQGTDIRRVIVVPDQNDAEVKLLTVELYADGVIVRYVVPSFVWPVQDLNAPLPEDFGAEVIGDDTGTEYQFEQGGGSAVDGSPYRASATFTPSVPPAATKLRVATRARGDARIIEIAL